MARRPKRPRDPAQHAKLIVEIATGEKPNDSPKGQDSPATEARRKGGVKGGAARARALSARKRKAIAKTAACARWERKQAN